MGLLILVSIRILGVSLSLLKQVQLFSGGSLSGAVELRERLRLSIPEALVSKPFQHYYRKATEGRAVHLDEGLYADFVEAMRVDIANVTTLSLHSRALLLHQSPGIP
jgi:hypothetical protein